LFSIIDATCHRFLGQASLTGIGITTATEDAAAHPKEECHTFHSAVSAAAATAASVIIMGWLNYIPAHNTTRAYTYQL